MDPRYIRPTLCADLMPEQVALLVRIMEEASEVAQAAAKMLRFGIVARDIVHGDTIYNNNDLLMRELSDLMLANLDLQKSIP